jgi:apolipoprotein N-acyltransferase
MNAALATWLAFRVLRWLGWLGFLAYSIGFFLNPRSHFDNFGQLLHTTEAALFGFALVSIFAGFLELMMRERAGFDRPTIGRLIPPRRTPAK